MSTTHSEWHVVGTGSYDALQLHRDVPRPSLGDRDVLVRFYGASINFRDLTIATGDYPFPTTDGVVPGSDGAGKVLEVGSNVKRFTTGDRVVTSFFRDYLAGELTEQAQVTGFGGQIDGTLRQLGAFDEDSLVHMPQNLTYVEAATLTCAGLTAWNALYGLEGKAVKAGDWVLTQGTGGVSIYALQLAKVAGARVIATTSSTEKEERLKQLGADYVINYKNDRAWGETAKKITGGRGVQHIIEVGGEKTLPQTFAAAAVGCLISIIGYIGGESDGKPTQFIEALKKAAIVRGIQIGSRIQLEQLCAAVEAANIKPVLDGRVFSLDEVKEAYLYQHAQQHFSKIAIRID